MKLRTAAVLFFPCLFFSFISCSSAEPKINSVSSVVVFEYKDEKSFPESHLSLFISSDENQRLENITAVHINTGLKWKIEEPRKFAGKDNKLWSGSTKLYGPNSEPVPQGKYTVFYTNADGQEVQYDFLVNYPAAISRSYINKARTLFTPGYTTKICLYNKEGKMTYMGLLKGYWTDNSLIKKEYPSAVTKRICYCNSDSTVFLMKAPESLEDGNKNISAENKQTENKNGKHGQ